MSDKRKARRAKQARRDARRAKKRDTGTTATSWWSNLLSGAVRGHPGRLLGLASCLVEVMKPESGERFVDSILDTLVGLGDRDTTVLIAVLAELLFDEPEARERCRREVAERNHHVPRWISALPQLDVYRAVRRVHVLGDLEDVLIGARIDGRHDVTIAVQINHSMCSNIVDGGVFAYPIDETLNRIAEIETNFDAVETDLAEARAWIESALSKPIIVPRETKSQSDRPLLRWLVQRLPEGGECRQPSVDWSEIEEVCARFFSTDAAAPFDSVEHRMLLPELLGGRHDPLRWSALRAELAIRYDTYDDYPLEVALDVPDLLRAFIPFAHAQCGIRDELTAQTVATLDELRSGYKRAVLRRDEPWDVDDAV
ncbi:hypothetical protein [Mycolicibacterium goodii]|uniref:Uncharacterized protein n=1 Tax=Mycolicibacterium goodii TaxID=134601 RepID=A0A0K0XEM6_MYCGD|nr:hypothetical protein AFA91_32335 [Mycolicibacterium goodii]